jgi:putative membrane protein
MASLFSFLHFAAAFALFGALAGELVLTRCVLDATTARRLLAIDLMYGVSAAVVLFAGLVRVFYFAKGPAYYFHSMPFIAKLAIFALVALLSTYPTMQFMAWRPSLKRGVAPSVAAATLRRIRLVIHLEATLVVVLILCASLAAHGVGVIGS